MRSMHKSFLAAAVLAAALPAGSFAQSNSAQNAQGASDTDAVGTRSRSDNRTSGGYTGDNARDANRTTGSQATGQTGRTGTSTSETSTGAYDAHKRHKRSFWDRLTGRHKEWDNERTDSGDTTRGTNPDATGYGR